MYSSPFSLSARAQPRVNQQYDEAADETIEGHKELSQAQKDEPWNQLLQQQAQMTMEFRRARLVSLTIYSVYRIVAAVISRKPKQRS